MEKTSQYRGVYRERRMTNWTAALYCQGKQHVLGYYENEKDAALAYDMTAREVQGISAKLNFPKITDYSEFQLDEPKILFEARQKKSIPTASAIRKLAKDGFLIIWDPVRQSYIDHYNIENVCMNGSTVQISLKENWREQTTRETVKKMLWEEREEQTAREAVMEVLREERKEQS